mmetsp:Transcript_9964/g.20326  ORF Transcript_9964/g.20326 Transcript_9964/m.20326 type:complete len:650 (-) Transcript_9964:20-1969(-)
MLPLITTPREKHAHVIPDSRPLSPEGSISSQICSSEGTSPYASSSPASELSQGLLEQGVCEQYKLELVGRTNLDAHLRARLIEAFWCIGCEPRIETVREIMRSSDSRVALTMFHNVLLEDGVGLEEFKEKMRYYRRMQRLPMRPESPSDPFVLYKARKWFKVRLVSAFIPFRSHFTSKNLFPQFTVREKAVLRISSFLTTVCFALTSFLWLVLFGLTISGTITSVSLADCLASLLLWILLSTSQVARESMCWSEEGLRSEAAYQYERFLLYYLNDFTSEFGEKQSGIEAAFRMFDDCGYSDMQIDVLMSHSSHAYALKLRRERLNGGQTRTGSIHDELEQIREKRRKKLEKVETEKKMTENEKYATRFAMYHPTSNKFVPLIFSIIVSMTPAVIRHVSHNERSIFDYGLQNIEIFVQVVEIVYIWIMLYAFNIIILADAYNDISVYRQFASWLDSSLKDEFDSETMTFRLHSGSNVEAFRTLHRFVFLVYSSFIEYHLAAFEFASFIAICSCVLVFSMTIMDVEFNVSMGLLFVMGSVITVAMTYVFFNASNLYSVLVLNIVRGLNAHQRKNCIEIDYLQTISIQRTEDMTNLKKANEKIGRLISEIVDEHHPVKLWKCLPLTKDNVIKLAGALVASLFTTVLRMALKS